MNTKPTIIVLILFLLGLLPHSLSAQDPLNIVLEGPSFCASGNDAASPALYSFEYPQVDNGTALCTEVTWEITGGTMVDSEGDPFPDQLFVSDCNGGGIAIENYFNVGVVWDDDAPVQEIKVKVKIKIKGKFKFLFFSIGFAQSREGEDKILYKRVAAPESLELGPPDCGSRVVTVIMPPLEDCRQPDRLQWSVNGSFLGFGTSRIISTSPSQNTEVQVFARYGISNSLVKTVSIPADVQVADQINGPNNFSVGGFYNYSISTNADQITWSVSTPNASITPTHSTGARLHYFVNPVVAGIITISAEITKCGQTITKYLDVAVGPCPMEPCGPLIDAPGTNTLRDQAAEGFELDSQRDNEYVSAKGQITGTELNATGGLTRAPVTVPVVYPNPVGISDEIRLKLPVQNTPFTVSLRNASGQEVLRKTLQGTDSSLTRNGLPKGMYFLTVRTSTEKWVEKLILR